MTTKKSCELTLKDRLSRLSFQQAVRLLGAEGKALLTRGGALPMDDLDNQVHLHRDTATFHVEGARVDLRLENGARHRLRWTCSECTGPCEHVGAAFATVLENKMVLGLAKPPRERVPVESLSEEALVAAALAEREERARVEKMRIRALDPHVLWTDYTVTNPASGKSYRVALRGWAPGESYCACPDFRKNTLGTCKHILHVQAKVKKKFSARQQREPYRRQHFGLHLAYGKEVALRLLQPAEVDAKARRIVGPIADCDVEDMHDLLQRLRRLERLGHEVVVYPDAEAHIQQRLFQDHIERLTQSIRRNPARHPLRQELLKAELLPYQLDGIAFAVGAGRAILADDMGLGKTIQAIGVAELLAREAGIERVLVICPTSLKSQWRSEISRFCARSSQLVIGSAAERAAQYDNDAFFTLCNYEQVLRDINHIEDAQWDLIVLDEGQRIKNWETRTTRIVKSLRSRFALVLSGTPLENRLDDLFSVVEFVDERRLGPAFRFFNRHRVVDDRGKVLGYQNLSELRTALAPILLRRTRASVMKELPERTTEIRRIPATEEQVAIDVAQMQVIQSIVNKRYISEMDLLRLQRALLVARMAADSTYLADKEAPGFSSKLEELEGLLAELLAEGDRKIVLFSEWTTMLDLIEARLQDHGVEYVRLDGSIPQKKRQPLVNTFQKNEACKLFLTTNAGSTGLNLQAANTVINVDLPWNPAVLEQRIARAHRMGQKRPVQVYLLVSEGTIEERMLATLSSKQQLALAALDPDSEIDDISLSCGLEELKKRLEVLVGAREEAPPDKSGEVSSAAEAARLARRERVALAGGQLLTAAFSFLKEMVPPSPAGDVETPAAAGVKASLQECLDVDAEGRAQLTVTLPDAQALDALAESVAGLLALQQG